MYWKFQDEMAVINGITRKGRCVMIPEAFKRQALDQFHVSHMGIEKPMLLACKSVYWVNINDDIEKLHYMSYISADTTEAQDNTSGHPSKAVGGNWCRYVHSKQ